MAIERTPEGLEIRLVSRGCDRYVTAPFLMVWLCGWAAGEGFAIWLLVKGGIALLTGRPPDPGHAPLDLGPALLAGLFLLVWLSLWTVGGVAAFSELFRLLWGQDRITVSSGRLAVAKLRGPFRSRQSFDRHQIRRLTLIGQYKRLGLETQTQRIELSALGSPAERQEAVTCLRAEFGIPDEPSAATTTIPTGWEEIITPEGERALVTDLTMRRRQARVAGVGTLLLAATTFLIARKAIGRPDLLPAMFILLAFTLGAAAGALWLTRGRWEWRVTKGRLTLRKRYGPRVRDIFEARRLLLDTSRDSDGDVWYSLEALPGMDTPPPTVSRWGQVKNRRTVARRMNEAGVIRDLGVWLSRESGLELEDRTSAEAQKLNLAELRAQLERSGRFGRWAAKAVDRFGDDEQKTGGKF